MNEAPHVGRYSGIDDVSGSMHSNGSMMLPSARIFADDRSKMDDNVGPIHQSMQRCGIRDVAEHASHIGPVKSRGIARGPDQDCHVMSASEQFVDDVSTNESGGPRTEYLHHQTPPTLSYTNPLGDAAFSDELMV